MSAVTNPSPPSPSRRWILLLAGGIVLLGGAIFLALSAVTAQITRANMQAQLATMKPPQGVLEIEQLTGGWNWSKLKLRLGKTTVIFDANLQHYGLNTWITGTIYDTNKEANSIATLTGNISTTPWNDTVFANMVLSVAAGQWTLPIGALKTGPANLHIEMQINPQALALEAKTVATELYYQGFPVLHISTLVQHTKGVLNTKVANDMWWDANLTLNADSDYGLLRAEAHIIGPNDIIAILQTGRIRMRTILPNSLWTLTEPWLPGFTQYLIKNGMMKSQGELRITDALFQDGAWYAPAVKKPAKNPTP